LGFAAHGWLESLLLPSLFGEEHVVVLAAAGVFAGVVPPGVLTAALPVAVAAVAVAALAPDVAAPPPVVDVADAPAPGVPTDPVTAEPAAAAGRWFGCLGRSEGDPPTISPDVPVTEDGIPSGATPPSAAGGPASGTSSAGALAPVGTVSTAAEFPESPTGVAPIVLPAAVGLSTSPASISLGGFRLGLPPFEAWLTSGLLLIAAKPRRITVGWESLALGFCLVSCRRASAAGSGCGTGTPAAISLFLASGLYNEPG
jgi:hypothetical protein